MKKFSKRALSTLLAVIMVLSVFTIIPITASAEATNVALNKTVYVSGVANAEPGCTGDKAVDGANSAQNSDRWASTEVKSQNTQAEQTNVPQWLIIDFGVGATVTDLQNVVIHWNARRWAANYDVYTAETYDGELADGVTLDFEQFGEPIHTTVRDADAVTGHDNSNVTDTLNASDSENGLSVTELKRYLLLKLNLMNHGPSVGGNSFSIQEIEVFGTLNQPELATVAVNSGTGTKSVSISNAPKNADVSENVVSVPVGEEQVSITISATPSDENLTFDGWYKGENKIDGATDESFTYNFTPTSGLNEVITAKYTGFSADISQYDNKNDLLTEYKNYNILQHNANANSANHTNAENTGGAPFVPFRGSVVQDDNWRWLQHKTGEPAGFGSTDHVSSDNEIWISTGFDDPATDGVETLLLGAISYLGDIQTDSACFNSYRIDVSNYPDFNNYVTVGTGTIENQNSTEQMLYFNAPHEAAYVRLVALSAHAEAPVAARQIKIYEYIGATSTTKGEITVNVDGTPIGTIEADGHALTADGKPDYISRAQLLAAATNEVLKQFNNIEYDYTVSVTDGDGYDGHEMVVEATKNVHNYTLTVADDAEASIAPVPYNGNFSYTAKESTGEFKYWADSDNNPVAIGKTFNYKATQDYNIKAVYDTELDQIAAYIPQPIVSRLNNQYKIQIPVSLFNLPKDAEFGIVFADSKTYLDKDALISALKAENNSNYIISKPSETVTPNNKGRYLHTVTVDGKISESDVYAFIETSDGNYTLSNVQQIAEKAALASD